MDLNLFFLAPLLQCTSIDVHCSWELKKKKLFYSGPVIKIIKIPLSQIFSHFRLSLSLSLSHSLSRSFRDQCLRRPQRHPSLLRHTIHRCRPSLSLSLSLCHRPKPTQATNHQRHRPRRDLWVSGGRGWCDGGGVGIVGHMGFGFWWILVGMGWTVGWCLDGRIGVGMVIGWPD